MAPVKAQKSRCNLNAADACEADSGRELGEENPSSGFPSNSEICRQISEAKMVKKRSSPDKVNLLTESSRVSAPRIPTPTQPKRWFAAGQSHWPPRPNATAAWLLQPFDREGSHWTNAHIVYWQILTPRRCIYFRPQSSSSSVHPTAVDDEASSEHRHKPDTFRSWYAA